MSDKFGDWYKVQPFSGRLCSAAWRACASAIVEKLRVQAETDRDGGEPNSAELLEQYADEIEAEFGERALPIGAPQEKP